MGPKGDSSVEPAVARASKLTSPALNIPSSVNAGRKKKSKGGGAGASGVGGGAGAGAGAD